MSDYIKREDVLSFCGKVVDSHQSTQRSRLIANSFNNFAVWVENIPASDVVEVVRCRDCKYYNTVSLRGLDGDVHEVKHCNLFGFTFEPNDFCSYGERRSE